MVDTLLYHENSDVISEKPFQAQFALFRLIIRSLKMSELSSNVSD